MDSDSLAAAPEEESEFPEADAVVGTAGQDSFHARRVALNLDRTRHQQEPFSRKAGERVGEVDAGKKLAAARQQKVVSGGDEVEEVEETYSAEGSQVRGGMGHEKPTMGGGKGGKGGKGGMHGKQGEGKQGMSGGRGEEPYVSPLVADFKPLQKYDNETMAKLKKESKDNFTKNKGSFQTVFNLMKMWYDEMLAKLKKHKKKIDQLEKNREVIFGKLVEIAERLKKGEVKRIVLPDKMMSGMAGGMEGKGGKGVMNLA